VYAEVYRSQEDAMARERMLKHHGSAKQKLIQRIKHSLVPKEGLVAATDLK